MKIPEEWLSEIYNNLLERSIIERPCLSRIESDVIDHLNSQINIAWSFSESQAKEFKNFFISTIISQCNPWTHGLTCGIDSNHALLVPRIDSQNKCYLLCPSCGWVQYNSPIGRNI